jgi:hypothetical protein
MTTEHEIFQHNKRWSAIFLVAGTSAFLVVMGMMQQVNTVIGIRYPELSQPSILPISTSMQYLTIEIFTVVICIGGLIVIASSKEKKP